MPSMFRVSIDDNGGFQKWTGYGDSIFRSSDYPYQSIISDYGNPYLVCSAHPLYRQSDTSPFYVLNQYTNIRVAHWRGTYWQDYGDGITIRVTGFFESNSPVYTDISLTTVLFNKTTTPPQDSGIVRTAISIDEGVSFAAVGGSALSELLQSVSEGKTLVADAITNKGVPTAASDSFSTMASKIGEISSGSEGVTGCVFTDGANDYIELPSAVGDLTGDFELEIIIQRLNSVQSTALCKRNTSVSSWPPGWRLEINNSTIELNCFTGVSGQVGSAVMSGINPYRANKINIKRIGTTVAMTVNDTGIATITNGSYLNNGLNADFASVLTLGRHWDGNWYYSPALNTYSLHVWKNGDKDTGVLTYAYSFDNAGTNQSVIDSESAANGSSYNGTVQSSF